MCFSINVIACTKPVATVFGWQATGITTILRLGINNNCTFNNEKRDGGLSYIMTISVVFDSRVEIKEQMGKHTHRDA